MAGNVINPELAAILQNLAHLSKPQGAPEELSIATPASISSSASQNATSSTSVSAQKAPRPLSKSALVASQAPTKSSTPAIDPATIIEFPAAAKFVVKNIASDSTAANRIKRLINNQHDNEKTWWNGREALIEKHKARVEGRKQVDSVLKALGVTKAQEEAGPVMTVEEEQASLESYDRKVYAALGQMATAIDKELASLSIPFFVIRHSLVSDGADGGDGVISKEHLVELQKKMMQFLEDLFGE